MPQYITVKALLRILHILLLLCIFRAHSFAQSYRENYELFTTRTGLPNNAVLSIVQDDRNLLWIGTRKGLCIFDGYEFEVKRDVFGTPDGDWGNIFHSLCKDGKGNIWFATQNGKTGVYNVHTGKVTSLATNDFTYQEHVVSMLCDASGTMWLGTNSGGLFMGDEQGKRLVKASPKNFGSVLSIQQGPGKFIINHYDSCLHPAGRQIPVQHIPAYLRIEDGYMLFCNTSRIIKIYENEIITRRHYTTCITPTGRLLIATSNLVKEYDTSGRLANRLVIGDDANSDNEDIANFIFEDATGIIWLGTNSGLIKIDSRKYFFTKFTTGGSYAKLNNNYVRAVFTDDRDNIWVGYRGGLPSRLAYDSAKQKFSSTSYSYAGSGAPAISAGAINIIRQLRSGILLFGGAEGLFFLPPNPGKAARLNRFLLKKDTVAGLPVEVWSLHEDRRGRVWAGTRAVGLYIIDPATRRFRHYKYDGITRTSPGLAPVWQVFEDYKGDIWLATESGLDSVIMRPDGYPAGFYNLHGHYSGEAGRQVWSVAEDTLHRLWIGTTDNGFSRVDKEKQAFITYGRGSGLTGNVVCGLLFDRKGYLWMSTISGISRFDVANQSFTHFSESDGLPGNDFNFNACYRAPSGRLLFGTKSGLTLFDPAAAPAPRSTGQPVLVRTFNLWDKKYIDNPPAGKTITLAHNQNFFSFRFALPDYRAPETHYFRYMLQGFSNQWTKTDARHPIATFTNVPPGEYTLLVQGSGDGSRWGSKTTQLHLAIQPAFWQQPFFRLGLLLLLATGAALLVYKRFTATVAKEREKSRIGQKFAELEFRALQAQMNPHFIFNSINAIQHFMLSHNEITANAYLSRFARLMRLYLESSKNKYIPLSEEIDMLKLYVHLEHLRFEDKFEYSFSIGPGLESAQLEVPSMLLQPHVENAINHGLALRDTKGTLYISIHRTDNSIVCIIDDNGIGRHAAGRRRNGNRSRGIGLVQERLAAYKAMDEIEIKTIITDKMNEDGTPAGTRVEVIMPAQD